MASEIICLIGISLRELFNAKFLKMKQTDFTVAYKKVYCSRRHKA